MNFFYHREIIISVPDEPVVRHATLEELQEAYAQKWRLNVLTRRAIRWNRLPPRSNLQTLRQEDKKHAPSCALCVCLHRSLIRKGTARVQPASIFLPTIPSWTRLPSPNASKGTGSFRENRWGIMNVCVSFSLKQVQIPSCCKLWPKAPSNNRILLVLSGFFCCFVSSYVHFIPLSNSVGNSFPLHLSGWNLSPLGNMQQPSEVISLEPHALWTPTSPPRHIHPQRKRLCRLILGRCLQCPFLQYCLSVFLSYFQGEMDGFSNLTPCQVFWGDQVGINFWHNPRGCFVLWDARNIWMECCLPTCQKTIHWKRNLNWDLLFCLDPAKWFIASIKRLLFLNSQFSPKFCGIKPKCLIEWRRLFDAVGGSFISRN